MPAGRRQPNVRLRQESLVNSCAGPCQPLVNAIPAVIASQCRQRQSKPAQPEQRAIAGYTTRASRPPLPRRLPVHNPYAAAAAATAAGQFPLLRACPLLLLLDDRLDARHERFVATCPAARGRFRLLPLPLLLLLAPMGRAFLLLLLLLLRLLLRLLPLSYSSRRRLLILLG
jgi:hypothetical protein